MVKLCECGCGLPAPIAPHTNPKQGRVKGEPMRFVNGHQNRSHVREYKSTDPIIRFWKMVDKDTPVHPILGTSCWLWTGCKLPYAHGQFNVGNHKIVLAHRFSWELHYGSIPEGLYVCHHCDNPSCVRPDHLFIGTQKDNVQDCIQKGRPGYLDWKKKK